MVDNESHTERSVLLGTLVVLSSTVALATADVVLDLMEGASSFHVIVEGGVILTGLIGVVFVSRHLIAITRQARAASREARELSTRLRETEADSMKWRTEAQELMRGLGQAIDSQFERWALSPAEKEVALLLMKGFSHREIAEIREVTPATARQQAAAIYRKAGLEGRNALAAFFLEDLMLPASAETSGT